MHMFSREKDFYGGHGIVGAQVPLGAGLAFANQYREQRQRLLHLLRRRRGQPGPGLRELQHGGLWKLPVIYVIENNQYAMGTSLSARSPPASALHPRRSLRHPRRGGRRHGRARGARRRRRRRSSTAAAAKGPYILEMNTYRYRGHSMSDPAKYRTREEVQKMREERDPIDHVRER